MFGFPQPELKELVKSDLKLMVSNKLMRVCKTKDQEIIGWSGGFTLSQVFTVKSNVDLPKNLVFEVKDATSSREKFEMLEKIDVFLVIRKNAGKCVFGDYFCVAEEFFGSSLKKAVLLDFFAYLNQCGFICKYGSHYNKKSTLAMRKHLDPEILNEKEIVFKFPEEKNALITVTLVVQSVKLAMLAIWRRDASFKMGNIYSNPPMQQPAMMLPPQQPYPMQQSPQPYPMQQPPQPYHMQQPQQPYPMQQMYPMQQSPQLQQPPALPMQYPNQPLIIQQQAPQPAFLHVFYEAENCCCGGQPRRGQFKVLVDNGEVGTIRQGQESTFPITAGLHVITAKQGGVGGFFAKIGGTGSTGQLSLNFAAGETKNARIFWRGGGCLSSKWYPDISNN